MKKKKKKKMKMVKFVSIKTCLRLLVKYLALKIFGNIPLRHYKGQESILNNALTSHSLYCRA